MESFEQKVASSTTVITKAVFPNTTNHYNTLFGGEALRTMDEVAFICATRFSKKRVLTISSDRVDFKNPIPAGTIAEFVACVVSVGNTSMKVKVEIFLEEMYSERRFLAINGIFTFVAVDENRQPIPIIDK